jgi:hypothetical protein
MAVVSRGYKPSTTKHLLLDHLKQETFPEIIYRSHYRAGGMAWGVLWMGLVFIHIIIWAGLAWLGHDGLAG